MTAVNTSATSLQTSSTRPNWPANVVVIAARILVSGTIWCYALLAMDDPRVGSQDVRIVTLRLGLWLYVAEMLYDLYRGTQYVTPVGFVGTLRLATKESFRAVGFALWSTPLSLAVRWTLLALLSAPLTLLSPDWAWLAYTAAFVPTLVIRGFRRWWSKRTATPQFPVIRGTHLGSYLEAVARAAALVIAELRQILAEGAAVLQRRRGAAPVAEVVVHTVPWGGAEIPLRRMEPHYLLLGTAGSGKTLSLRLLMQAVLAIRRGGLRARAVVYDAKREFYTVLTGMGIPPEAIVILNPADSRSAAWDLAKDIQTKDDARNIAITLVPNPGQQGKENPFFGEAVQGLLTAVMWALHRRSPGAWTLLDVLRPFATPDTLKAFLQPDPDGRNTYQRYFTSALEATGGIVSTIDTKLISPYESIAHLWARSDHRVSLKAWSTDPRPSILILGTDENRASVDRINQAMFQRIVQLVSAKPDLAQDPDRHSDQTWFFLDELRFAGELPMIGHLISLGRSKGVRAVLATQDLDGLYAAYGENKGNELLALCGNIAAFRLISPKTREWAAKLFGEYEGWERDYSFSVSSSRSKTTSWGTVGTDTKGDSESRSTHAKIVKRESILPSEFFAFPKPGPDTGIPGFFATAEMGAWRGPVPWDFLVQRLKVKDPHAEAFVPRSPTDYESPDADGPAPETLFPVEPTHPAGNPPPPPAPAPASPRPSRRGRLPQ